jgi:hypothetical protein
MLERQRAEEGASSALSHLQSLEQQATGKEAELRRHAEHPGLQCSLQVLYHWICQAQGACSTLLKASIALLNMHRQHIAGSVAYLQSVSLFWA